MNSKILVQILSLIFNLTLIVELSSGQFLYREIHDDCKEDDSYCVKNSECCSGYCTFLTCGPCQETDSWCALDSDCCSDICTLLTCRDCKTDWESCLTDHACCSNRCDYFKCWPEW